MWLFLILQREARPCVKWRWLGIAVNWKWTGRWVCARNSAPTINAHSDWIAAYEFLMWVYFSPVFTDLRMITVWAKWPRLASSNLIDNRIVFRFWDYIRIRIFSVSTIMCCNSVAHLMTLNGFLTACKFLQVCIVLGEFLLECYCIANSFLSVIVACNWLMFQGCKRPSIVFLVQPLTICVSKRLVWFVWRLCVLPLNLPPNSNGNSRSSNTR